MAQIRRGLRLLTVEMRTEERGMGFSLRRGAEEQM